MTHTLKTPFLLFFSLLFSVFFLLGSAAQASHFSEAVTAYYQKDYGTAKKKLSVVSSGDPDREELLSSLIALKTGDLDSALASFYRVDFARLKLGRYEPLVRLQFLLIDPKATTSDLVNALHVTKDQIGQNPLYSQLTLQVANRLMHEGNSSDAFPLYLAISGAGGTSATTLEANKALIQIYCQQGQAEPAISLFKKLMLTPLSVGEMDTLLGTINRRFGLNYNFRGILNQSDHFLRFFRTLYDRQDYQPTLRYGKQFYEAYPDHAAVPEVKTNMVMCAFLQGQLNEAIASFDMIVAAYPNTYWAAKSLFYKGRSLQKLKQYEAAKIAFLAAIECKNNDEFIGDSYYYLYWCFEALNDVSGFAALYDRFKHSLRQGKNLDQLVWNLAWQMYQTGKVTEAYDLLRYHPLGLASDDFKSRVLFWMGKMASQFDPEKAQFYFQKCLNRFPLSYYSYRIAQNHIPKPLSEFSKRLKSTHDYADPYYLKMVQLGLAEWVIPDLQGQIREKKPNYRHLAYTLATFYIQQNRPYEAIMLIANSGISSTVQGQVSKEWMKVLYPRPFWSTIEANCKRFGVDPFLALALMREESLFNPQARSKSGAMGLMQLMPATAEGLAKGLSVPWLGPDMAYDPDINIQFGVCYVGSLKKRFNNNFALILSGYNAGPNITQKWSTNFQDKDIDHFVAAIPYSETNGYVTRVLKSYWIYRILYSQN